MRSVEVDVTLNPRNRLGVLDYCPLRVEYLFTPCEMKALLKEKEVFYTHFLFTSQTAVHFWREGKVPFLSKELLAVGQTTAQLLEKVSCQEVSYPKEEESLEGVCELLSENKVSRVIWPRSVHSRSLLSSWAQKKGVLLWEIPFYHLLPKISMPQRPPLEEIKRVFFYSSSLADIFFKETSQEWFSLEKFSREGSLQWACYFKENKEPLLLEAKGLPTAKRIESFLHKNP